MLYGNGTKVEYKDIIDAMERNKSLNDIKYEAVVTGTVAGVISGGRPDISEQNLRRIMDVEHDNIALRLRQEKSPGAAAMRYLKDMQRAISLSHAVKKATRGKIDIDKDTSLDLACKAIQSLVQIGPIRHKGYYDTQPKVDSNAKNFDGYRPGPQDDENNEDKGNDNDSDDDSEDGGGGVGSGYELSNLINELAKAAQSAGAEVTKDMIEALAQAIVESYLEEQKEGDEEQDSQNGESQIASGSYGYTSTHDPVEIMLEHWIDPSLVLNNAAMVKVPQMQARKTVRIESTPNGKQIGVRQLNLTTPPMQWTDAAIGVFAAASDLLVMNPGDYRERFRYNIVTEHDGLSYFTLLDVSGSMYYESGRLGKALSVAMATAMAARESKSSLNMALFSDNYMPVSGLINALLTFGIANYYRIIEVKKKVVNWSWDIPNKSEDEIAKSFELFVSGLPKLYGLIARRLVFDIGLSRGRLDFPHREFSMIIVHEYPLEKIANAMMLVVGSHGNGGTNIPAAISRSINAMECYRTDQTDILHLTMVTDEDSSSGSVEKLPRDVRLHLFSVADNPQMAAIAQKSGGAVFSLESIVSIDDLTRKFGKKMEKESAKGKRK